MTTLMVALRWRVENEVVMGKGQFQCGNKRCTSDKQLRSWEVNFAYVEENQKKNALVKIRLCPDCSAKLNYKSQKREVKRIKKKQKKKKKSKRDTGSSSSEEIEPRTPESNNPSALDEPTTSKPAELADSKDCDLWKKGAQEVEEKTREEEFEEYLEDLLL